MTRTISFRLCRVERKSGRIRRVKCYWEIIADNLSKTGWSCGCISTVTREGQIIWVADAHRRDGKRFVVHADDKPTAFVELEAAIHSGHRLAPAIG